MLSTERESPLYRHCLPTSGKRINSGLDPSRAGPDVIGALVTAAPAVCEDNLSTPQCAQMLTETSWALIRFAD